MAGTKKQKAEVDPNEDFGDLPEIDGGEDTASEQEDGSESKIFFFRLHHPISFFLSPRDVIVA
jgi:hypothetical protein